MTDALPGMPHGLTHEETEYVYNVEVLGLPVKKAARLAGMDLRRINADHVMAARTQVRDSFSRAQSITKESVTNMLMEAIDRAKTLAEPMTEIAGIDRLIKLHGLDEKKPDPNINVTINVMRDQVSRMSDRELVESLGVGNIVDGDFYVVRKDEVQATDS